MTDNLVFPPEGILSFCRSPLASLGEDGNADVVVLGVPWDGGTGLRGGARHGPRALREASQRIPLWLEKEPVGYWDVVLERQRLSGIRVVDVGDVKVVRASQERTNEATTVAARAARRSGKLLVTLGGDHSISFPLVQACDDYANLAIIQLDAHLDFADSIQGVRLNSSTPMRRIAELPFIGPMAVLGLRGLRTDPTAFAAAHQRGNTLVTRAALRDVNFDEVIARLPRMDHAYLSIDIDVLDPQLAPGVSAPELDGLSFHDLRSIVQAIARHVPIVGIDLVETSPPLDPAGLTALAGVQVLVEVLAAIFEQG